MGDLEEVGIPKVAEMVLDCAWDGTQAVYLSYLYHIDIHSFVLYQGWAGRFPWNSAELFRRNGCRQLEVDSVAAVPLTAPEFLGNVEIPRKSSRIVANIPENSEIPRLPLLPFLFVLPSGIPSIISNPSSTQKPVLYFPP